MKKPRKGLVLVFPIMVLVLFMLFMSSAFICSKTHTWKVCTQANTKWVSEDGAVVFFVSNDLSATGSISINGKRVEVYMTEGPLRSKEMHIYPIDVLENEITSEKDKYEHWICSYESEGKFIATIINTTFFTVGQQLIFYRTDSFLPSEKTAQSPGDIGLFFLSPTKNSKTGDGILP